MVKKEGKKSQIREAHEEVERKIEDKVKKALDGFTPGYGHKRNFGQKAADLIAKWAGSWAFILFFFVFLGLWMAANVYAWIQEWDPYPFILLNLILSCLAAVQAPVILMSQNRAAQRDRLKAENDYQVNRKAEKEIQLIISQLKRIEKKICN